MGFFLERMGFFMGPSPGGSHKKKTPYRERGPEEGPMGSAPVPQPAITPDSRKNRFRSKFLIDLIPNHHTSMEGGRL